MKTFPFNYTTHNQYVGKGEFVWLDGRRYKGEYIEDRKEGYGVFTWADSRVYSGQWLAGKQHGIGLYIGTDGIEKEGEWKDGKRIRWIKKGGQPVTSSKDKDDNWSALYSFLLISW